MTVTYMYLPVTALTGMRQFQRGEAGGSIVETKVRKLVLGTHYRCLRSVNTAREHG